MTAPTGGYVLKETEILFDGTDYANQITKARLVPETPMQQMRTLVPDGIIADVDSSVWTFELEGIQDWTAAGTGFAGYLNTNAGSTVTVTYTPKPSGVVATFDVIVMPVEFGGEQGAWTKGSVILPVVGQPAFA